MVPGLHPGEPGRCRHPTRRGWPRETLSRSTMAKKPSITTVYDADDAGTLAFARREDFAEELAAYLEVVQQLKVDYKDDPRVLDGLHEVEVKLQALRVSADPEEEVRERIRALVEVPLGEGKTLRLDAFRHTAAQTKLESEGDYRERVKRLVRNTAGNLAHLLLTYPDDAVLQRFMQEIAELNLDGDYKALRHQMAALSKSPQLWRYNEKKKDFLKEWLLPFQAFLETPVEEMSPEEFQEALKKVEGLRDRKLEEMTNLERVEDHEPFRQFNRTMHAAMNGKNKEFWGGTAVRDEFIALMNKLITRFSFKLEDRFLVFRTKDGGFYYLVGFSDDAFAEAMELKGGQIGLYPHLKVFLKGGDKEAFSELSLEAFAGNGPAFYRSLKTAVVPFLVSISTMIEFDLSPEIREAFDMWI